MPSDRADNALAWITLDVFVGKAGENVMRSAQVGEFIKEVNSHCFGFGDDDALGCGLAFIVFLRKVFLRLHQLAFENLDGAAGGGNLYFNIIPLETCSGKT